MRRLRNQLDETAAKFLLKLSKKGKGLLDPQLAARVLGPLGWRFESQPVALDMDRRDVSYGIGKKLGHDYVSIEKGMIQSWHEKEIQSYLLRLALFAQLVRDKPSQPELGEYYYTTPSIHHSPNGRHELRTNIWRGGIRWIVTAPNGAKANFDVRDLGPLDLGPLWTFFYKHGLQQQATAKLTETPEIAAKATQTKAERERVEMQRSALPEIAAVFHKITDVHYQSTIKFLEAHIHKGVQDVLAIGDDERVSWDKIPWGRSVQHVMQSVRMPSGRYAWQAKPNLDRHVREEATRIANETREAFVLKNTARISEIAKRKGSVPVAKLLEIGSGSYGGYGGQILFTFPDGSRFTLRNKTVWKQSAGGVVFAQFPTTFHDVVLPSGKKMSSPSEARMLDVFAGGKASNPLRRLMR